MRLGIYGGTFDPPHIGHTQSVAAAAKQLRLDRLIIIPTGTPPHKVLPGDSPDSRERLEMTRIAAHELGFAEVSDLEIFRPGKSYTVDTVHSIKEQYPDADIFLLMGTDMLLSFETWKDFIEIMRSVCLAVFARLYGEDRKIKLFSDYLVERYDADVTMVYNDAIVEISSSVLRDLLPRRGGKEFICDEVYASIIKNRYYDAKPDFDWLRESAHRMLSPKRVPHVVGCEKEAVRLARRWDADEDEAREAAILHDITKKETLSEQLLLCEKYGIMTDALERENSKLLHSKTGAEIAKRQFGVSDEVYRAIFWHTTGHEDMTLLEKIIYLADYIEPTRDFAGVDKLRRLAYEDIDAALITGYRMSIEDLAAHGIVPHDRTLKAMKSLISVRQRERKDTVK
ncbi:MAG: nicotinate (nicotinamide) nucleotide adenylyltransferase [Oscillospiraceae bacterium]